MREILKTTIKQFRGKSTVIIGGGSTVSNLDIKKIPNTFSIITINESSKLHPNPDVILWTDGGWGAENSEFLYSMPATKFRVLNISYSKHFIEKNVKTEGDSNILGCTGDKGLDLDVNCVRGNNSGAYAINFAFNLGCRKIYLIGFDHRVCPKTRMANFHKNYKSIANDFIYQDTFLPSTQSVINECMARNCVIYNVNSKSRLKTNRELNFYEWDNILKNTTD